MIIETAAHCSHEMRRKEESSLGSFQRACTPTETPRRMPSKSMVLGMLRLGSRQGLHRCLTGTSASDLSRTDSQRVLRMLRRSRRHIQHGGNPLVLRQRCIGDLALATQEEVLPLTCWAPRPPLRAVTQHCASRN